MNTIPLPAFRRLKLSAKITLLLRRHRSVVVLAPHPDDEVLGCGLLIADLVRAGVKVAVIALTDGDASHPGSRRWPPAALAALRRSELRRALQRLGAGGAALRHMGWRDGHVARDGRTSAVAASCRALDAGLILAASADDHHPDHQACFALGAAVARRLHVPLVGYAVWSRVGGRKSDGPHHRRLHHHRHRHRHRHGAAKRWAVAAHRSQISDYISDAPDGFTLSQQPLKQFIEEPERYARAINNGTGRR